MFRTRRCVLIAVAALAVAVPGARAATWSEIPSNTTEDITAIEYQGPTRFWFATGAGHIFKRVGDAFVQTGTAPGVVFKDIEFQDGGQVGFAVGTNGGVLRSADGGDSWTPVTGLVGGQLAGADCAAAAQPLGDVDSIRFAGNARAWLVGGGTQIFRTIDGATDVTVGDSSAGWQLVNGNGVPCRINQDVDDAFPIPGSPAVYFAAKNGAVFFSPDALATDALPKAAAAGAGVTGTRRLAGDPANPNRQWAVTNGGAGGAFVARTVDGWSTSSGWTIAAPAGAGLTTPEGVDFNAGTVTAVGSGGMIAESVDGADFWLDRAAGAAAQDWGSVSLASASAGAIGGTGGRLVVSADANVPPAFAVPGVLPGAAPLQGSTGRPAPAVVVRPPRRPLPAFGFAPKSKPPVVGGVARKRGRFVNIAVFGAFGRPKGITPAVACKGTVALNVSKTTGRRRDLAEATTSLSRACTYAKLLRIRRARIGTRRSLRLRVTFRGNAAIRASSVTYRVPVK